MNKHEKDHCALPYAKSALLPQSIPRPLAKQKGLEAKTLVSFPIFPRFDPCYKRLEDEEVNMDLQEGLRTRRTVYKYTNRTIPPDVLNRCLDTARWAPNHKLTEPWRFLVVGENTRHHLGKVAKSIAKDKAGNASGAELEKIIEKQVRKIIDLPALVVIINRKTPDDSFREREDFAACVCALHNLVLALWAEGIGAQWSTGSMTRHPDALEILGVDSDVEDVIGFLKIGYPETIPQTRRKDLDDVVQYLD